jgi:Flp pilus assembly protein TadD
MKARTRILMLLGIAGIACAIIAVAMRSQRPGVVETASAPAPEGVPARRVPADDQRTPVRAPEDAAAEMPRGAAAGEALVLGQAAFARGDYAASVEHLQHAALRDTTLQDPERFQVNYLLGLAWHRLGRHEEANAAFATALDIAPRSVRALVNSGRVLLDLGRVDEAEERLRLAVEAAPQDGAAWNVLGRVHLVSERVAAAESCFGRAIEVDTTNAYARNNLGLLRLQRGAWQEAAAVLEEAVRLDDRIAYFHRNLGLAYERLGRWSDAGRAYARALELQPDHERTRLALARVNALAQPALAAAAPGPDSTRSEPAPER